MSRLSKQAGTSPGATPTQILDFTASSNLDEIAKSRFLDGVLKSAKIKAREFRVLRRTYRTPQGLRDEAQRRYWTFYGLVKYEN